MELIPLDVVQEEAVLRSAGYTRSKLKEDVVELREWLSRQDHLPAARLNENENFYMNFLLGCKGKINSCKKKLDSYYSLRARYPQLLRERDPKNIEHSFNFLEAGTVPEPTPEGSRISVAVVTTSQDFDFDSCLIRTINILEIRMRKEGIYNGDYIIIDVKNFMPKLMLKFSLTLLHQFLQFILKAIPSRLKGLVFINTSSLFQLGVNRFMKPFFKPEISKRIFMYSEGCELLEKHFDIKILPIELGGSQYGLKQLNNDWLLESRAWKKWFITDGSELSDESKRPKKARSYLSFLWKTPKEVTTTWT